MGSGVFLSFESGTVAGNPTFTGNITATGDMDFNSAAAQTLHLGNDDYLTMGNTAAAPRSRVGWNTAATPDIVELVSGSTSRYVVLTDTSGEAWSLGSASSHPTLVFPQAGAASGFYGTIGFGSANLRVATNSGGVDINPATGGGLRITTGSGYISGTPFAFKVDATNSAHTGITASTACPDIVVNLGRTKTWATGNIASQYDAIFNKATYAFAGASTVTVGATVSIDGAPTAGANATITNPAALWVQSGNSIFGGDLLFTADFAPDLKQFAQSSDTATNNLTITAQDAYVSVGALTNSNGGALVLKAGNANTSDTATGNGGDIQLFPGKRGQFGDGAVRFYDNKSDGNMYVAFRRNNSNQDFFHDYQSATGGESFGYTSSGTFYTSYRVLSATTSVNYIQATGAATGASPSFSAAGSDSNVWLQLRGKGTSGVEIVSPTSTTGNINLFKVTASANTSVTGASSLPDVLFDLSATKTWDTTAVSKQRDVTITPRTHAASGAKTFSEVYTLSIGGVPTPGTNATFGEVGALEIQQWNAQAVNASGNSINVKMPGIANGVGNITGLVGIGVNAEGGSNVSLGNQTATAQYIAGIAIPTVTYVSTTNTRTVSLLTAIYAEAPTVGANVSATPYAIYASGNVNVVGNVSVSDDAYAVGWNGSTNVPTKNAVYDKIESLLITSGTYTPTRSAETNLDSNVTPSEAQYLRVGSTVTVSGRFTADPTTTTLTTSFELTLPIASNLGAAEDLAGTAVCGNIVSMCAEVIGSAANNTAVVQWKASDVTSQTWSYSFTYQVI